MVAKVISEVSATRPFLDLRFFEKLTIGLQFSVIQ